jgi:two-component system response regulator HydG
MINIPPLKDSKDDIPLFAHHFLERANQELNKDILGFDEDALKCLKSYNWPGNLRELKNIIYRMVLVNKEKKITSGLILENVPEISHYLTKK